MLWPNGLKSRPLTSSPYGWRIHPVTGQRKLHAGVDLVGYQLVRAIEGGTVVAAGTPRGWEGGGIQVWVQHAGYLSRSMHLKSTPNVRVGDYVPEGRILGVMGMTGTATGVHHHLEIVVNGVQIDPIPFITDRLATPAGGSGGAAPGPAPIPIPTGDDPMFIKALTAGAWARAGVIYSNDIGGHWRGLSNLEGNGYVIPLTRAGVLPYAEFNGPDLDLLFALNGVWEQKTIDPAAGMQWGSGTPLIGLGALTGKLMYPGSNSWHYPLTQTPADAIVASAD
ncbi:hypothetical protein AUC47_04870 [Microbacterium sp. SZ1]|uniref:M23 family metallopeptidase n=1 Tax=Microbacterium sp. SZ1 TaxID=1849736 RepID=UPI000BC8B34C|nr:M23 family metallopeptidase [Microbacterium sp. SZ1]PCE13983.1 hypothetical protein AUC47_04870 [Microbacterium sp. SZ1]